MNRRSFMQSAFVGGIISAIGTKSIGKTIVEEKNVEKKERTKLIDYLDNGNRLCLGMYIAECSKFGTFFPVLCYQIIGMGAYNIGLNNVCFKGTNGIKSKIKSASNISKKEICLLIEKRLKSSFSGEIIKIDYKRWVIMEPEDIFEMNRRNEKNIKMIYS